MCFCNPSIRTIYCDSVICSLAKRKNKIIHDVQDNSDLKLLLNDNAELLEVFNNDCTVNRCFKTFGVSEDPSPLKYSCCHFLKFGVFSVHLS